jgi:hypothetical protein
MGKMNEAVIPPPNSDINNAPLPNHQAITKRNMASEAWSFGFCRIAGTGTVSPSSIEYPVYSAAEPKVNPDAMS